MYKEFFKDKKITIMGLGLLGRGVGDAVFLAECGARLTITDLRTKEALKPSLDKLKRFKGIKYVLGRHNIADFQKADFVLKAAGVSLDSVFIKEAKRHKIPIEMDVSLFAKCSPKTILIGITGTRGKSTTTALVYSALKQNEKILKKKVYLGGNMRGVAALPLLKKVKDGDILVCELDSWQLQGFREARISPHISVFTNLMPDHMNYYQDDLKIYFRDKSEIFLHQGKGDVLILGEKADLAIKKYGNKSKIKSRIVIARAEDIPENWKLKLRGEHNRENAALAREAAKAVHLGEKEIKKAFESFPGIPGRLELVKKIKGIEIYNDTNATTPEATVAAIKALSKGSKRKRIILIMGGSDKGLDVTPLWKEVLNHCKDLYFISGSGTNRIKPEAPYVPVYSSLKEAVKTAYKDAKKGDIILFSPAFASFGMFKNEYDRGDKFMKIIKSLQ